MLEIILIGILSLVFFVLNSLGYGWIILLIFIPYIIYNIYDWWVGGNLFQRTYKSLLNIELDEEWDEDDDKPIRKRKSISQNIKDKVWRRDGGKCVECGSKEKIEFDHIIPFSKGGSNTYRNLQILCENCNRSKSDKIG